MSVYYEVTLEIHRGDEAEALAIAKDLARDHAATATVTRVESAGSFADPARLTILATVSP